MTEEEAPSDPELEEILVQLKNLDDEHDIVTELRGELTLTFTGNLLAAMRAVLGPFVLVKHARQVREHLVLSASASGLMMVNEKGNDPLYPATSLAPTGVAFMAHLPPELGGFPSGGDGVEH